MKLILFSDNRKLGRYMMAATYRPVPETCPRTCRLLGNGCYAQRNWVGMLQRETDASWTHEELEAFISECARKGRLIRHHVSGDVMKPDGTVDEAYIAALVTLHELYQVKGYLYTHAWRDVNPEWFNENGYLVANASVDNLAEVHEATELGWFNVTITVPPDTEGGWYEDVLVHVCPADKGNDITCAQCRLCARSSRGFAIGFVSKNATSHAVIMDAWTDDDNKE